MLASRHLNSLAALTFLGVTAMTSAAIAAEPSSIPPERRHRHARHLQLCEPVGASSDDAEGHL